MNALKELFSRDMSGWLLVIGACLLAFALFFPMHAVFAAVTAFAGGLATVTAFDCLGWHWVLHWTERIKLKVYIANASPEVLKAIRDAVLFRYGEVDTDEDTVILGLEPVTVPDVAVTAYRCIQIVFMVLLLEIVRARVGWIPATCALVAWWTGTADIAFHWVIGFTKLPKWSARVTDTEARYWGFGYWMGLVGPWYWLFAPRDTADPKRDGKPVPMEPRHVYMQAAVGFGVALAGVIVLPLVL